MQEIVCGIELHPGQRVQQVTAVDNSALGGAHIALGAVEQSEQFRGCQHLDQVHQRSARLVQRIDFLDRKGGVLEANCVFAGVNIDEQVVLAAEVCLGTEVVLAFEVVRGIDSKRGCIKRGAHSEQHWITNDKINIEFVLHF